MSNRREAAELGLTLLIIIAATLLAALCSLL